MVLGIIREIHGEKREMPLIQAFPAESYEIGHIYTILEAYAGSGVTDATVETGEGVLLGQLWPNGQWGVFPPN